MKVFEPKKPTQIIIHDFCEPDDLEIIDEKQALKVNHNDNRQKDKEIQLLKPSVSKIPKMRILMPITIQVPKIRLNFDEIGDIADPHLKIDLAPSDTDTRKDETLKLESQKCFLKKQHK